MFAQGVATMDHILREHLYQVGYNGKGFFFSEREIRIVVERAGRQTLKEDPRNPDNVTTVVVMPYAIGYAYASARTPTCYAQVVYRALADGRIRLVTAFPVSESRATNLMEY